MSNDTAELKRFITAHARAQGVPRALCQNVLARIHTDEDWVARWSAAAHEAERAGKFLRAARLFGLARFPYVDGPARQSAMDSALAVFDRWRAGTGIEPLEITTGTGRVRCWSYGLSSTERRPLLVMTGGIVSTKEQWAPILTRLRRLGMAGVVTEMAGVGENTHRYDEESWRLYPDVLDAVADRADVGRTYLIALSFSGHLAFRAAVEDPRISGIITAGVPVHDFFTDAAWQRTLPGITVDTLVHVTGSASASEAFDRLRPMALGPADLTALKIPVHCMSSTRDEIIPAEDRDLISRHLAEARVVTNDDVHGAPAHMAQTRLWVVRSLIGMVSGRTPQYALLGLLLAAARLSRGFRS